jgi:transketolase
MALAAKTDKQDHMIFCICSDGEQDEGQTWEAVLSASKYKLNNLIVVLDRNNIQISGNTERIMPLIPLAKKYQSFGWNVIDIDGHSIYEIWQALAESRSSVEKPTVIIANTVPGKGVSFMQGSYKWHGRAPQGEEVTKALKELELAHNK